MTPIQRRIAYVLLLLSVLGFVAPASVAQSLTCNTLADAMRVLKKEHGEVLTSTGTTSSGGQVFLFKSKEKDTWTLLIASSPARACMMAAGEGWRKLIPDDPGA